MLIEIKYSNEKSEEDIEKLSVNKVPTVEIDIKNDNRCKHLVLPTLLEANKPRFEEVRRLFKEYSKGFKEKIEKSEREYRAVKQRFDYNIERIDEFKKGIRGDSSTQRFEIKIKMQKFREGIQSNGTERTRQISRNINGYRDRIQEEEYRLGDIKQEIKRNKSTIRRNKSTIRRNKSTIKNIVESSVEKLEAEIDRICREVEERRGNTEKIAKNCKIEWFKSSWMKSNYNNKIDEIRYWCS